MVVLYHCSACNWHYISLLSKNKCVYFCPNSYAKLKIEKQNCLCESVIKSHQYVMNLHPLQWIESQETMMSFWEPTKPHVKMSRDSLLLISKSWKKGATLLWSTSSPLCVYTGNQNTCDGTTTGPKQKSIMFLFNVHLFHPQTKLQAKVPASHTS